MKNTFQTIKYKNHYIHSCYNSETNKQEVTCQLMIPGYLSQVTEVKSIHAAKIRITSHIKSKNNAQTTNPLTSNNILSISG